MKLASFDIFDTTLIRKCGQPQNIFYLLATRLYPHSHEKRDKFFEWRKSAELLIAPEIRKREITIQDIYTGEGLNDFKEYTTKELIEAEKTVESENLTANPEIKTKIEEYREKGYTICFISDMYLDSKFLTQILRREGCLTGEEKVYVSCEEEARKSSGALYDKVRNYLTPAEWEHYGDHPVSDIKRAEEKRIKAHIVSTAYTEAEKLLAINSQQQYAKELSCLAGLQRSARIKLGDNPYTRLAADYVAAAYIPYVNFVLQKAQKQDIKALYFLSRDSYILQKIAEAQKEKYPNIEFKYLFVSRKALLLPYLKDAAAEKYLAIQDKNTIIGKSVEELLATFETSTTTLKEEYGISFRFKRISNQEEEKEFLTNIFGDNSPFRAHLEELCDKKRKIFNAYLIQEGAINGEKTAMVDVGWLGTTRLMINSILREEGTPDTLFFYYGVRGDVLGKQHGNFISYFTPNELSTELTSIVENYFSASPFPSTIGYKKEGNKIVPQFKQGEEFAHNNITTANTSVTAHISKEVEKIEFFNEEVQRVWSKSSAKELLTLKNKDIDLTPLCEAEIFDGKCFVRRLSQKELIRIMLTGGRVTAFDKASVRLTVGYRFFPLIWRICCASGNLRRFLYLNFIQKAKR